MVLETIVVLWVFHLLFRPIDKSIEKAVQAKIQKDKEYMTLASNGDDSFINGIMWADVGNDL